MERYSDALQAFKESMKIADEIKNEEFVAVNIFRTGTILCALGMWIEGRVSLRYALLLYNRVGHRDYAADVLKVIETFKGAGSFPSTRTALGLDRLFELGFTAEGVRRAVEEYPELLAPDILREFQQLSIEELGLSVLLEHLGAIGRALEICANDPSLSSKARRVLALQEERVNEAKVWFSRAVEFDAGRVAPPDHKAALQAFQKAADLGHAKAMYNLGVFCAEGRGVEKNYSEAMQWWMKAAALGDFEAAYNLGCHYYNGEGVERSPGDAFRWFIFAAERGSHDAQTYCGACYENGLGCDQDLQKAMRWYMKAAEQGDWRAECNIGTLYANGKGVNRNRVDACYWFYRSLIHLDEKRHAQEADKLRRYIACYVRFMSEEESHQMTLKTAALASELGPQGQERLTAIMQNFRDWITRQNFEDLVTEQDFEDWVTGKKQ